MGHLVDAGHAHRILDAFYGTTDERRIDPARADTELQLLRLKSDADQRRFSSPVCMTLFEPDPPGPNQLKNDPGPCAT